MWLSTAVSQSRNDDYTRRDRSTIEHEISFLIISRCPKVSGKTSSYRLDDSTRLWSNKRETLTRWRIRLWRREILSVTLQQGAVQRRVSQRAPRFPERQVQLPDADAPDGLQRVLHLTGHFALHFWNRWDSSVSITAHGYGDIEDTNLDFSPGRRSSVVRAYRNAMTTLLQRFSPRVITSCGFPNLPYRRRSSSYLGGNVGRIVNSIASDYDAPCNNNNSIRNVMIRCNGVWRNATYEEYNELLPRRGIFLGVSFLSAFNQRRREVLGETRRLIAQTRVLQRAP